MLSHLLMFLKKILVFIFCILSAKYTFEENVYVKQWSGKALPNFIIISRVAKLFPSSLLFPMWKRYRYISRKAWEMQIFCLQWIVKIDLCHSPPQSANEKGSLSCFIPVSSVVACKDSVLMQRITGFLFKILPVNIKIQQRINQKETSSEVF